MPLLGKSKEDSPALNPLLEAPVLRPQQLTQELLDWSIEALTAVLSTEQVQEVYNRGAERAVRDALKRLDDFYILTLAVEERQ